MRETIFLDNGLLVSKSAGSYRGIPRGSMYAWKKQEPPAHSYEEVWSAKNYEDEDDEGYSEIGTRSLSVQSRSVKFDVDDAVTKKALSSFQPETVPYIKKWFRTANTAERQTMGKLFCALASQPQKINENRYRPSYRGGRHLSYDETRDSCMDTHYPTLTRSEPSSTPNLPLPTVSRKPCVTTKERVTRPRVNRPIPLSDLQGPFRTEFDIAPDWRQPRFRTVPVLHRTLYGKSRVPPAQQPTWRRDFSIHPHWGLN